VYVDELIERLESRSIGCCIGNKFFGCCVYADDILILSPTIAGLQDMLNVCYTFANDNGITFNSEKSMCIKIGKMWSAVISDMSLGQNTIRWVDSFKYLGLIFNNGVNISVDCAPIRKKFYAAFNSIMCNCKTAAENVKMFLTNAYCLPVLTYCLGALNLTQGSVNSLNVCWNDAFRKIFGLHRWESVTPILYYCNVLPFRYMYELYRWNFLMACSSSCAPVRYLMSLSMLECDLLQAFCVTYSYSGSQARLRKLAVLEHFKAAVLPTL
jgi:hypothetical protein